MYDESDVYVRLRAASVVFNGTVARYADQVPFTVGNEATNIAALRRFLDEVQLHSRAAIVQRKKENNFDVIDVEDEKE